MKRSLLLAGTMILIVMIIAACGGDKNPTTSTNRAPGQPELDGGPSGAPINGATGVSITPTLKWDCTDPDGDALTYTVSFGTAAKPPVVSTDQSARTFSPVSLAYSTKYYWSVTAKDPAKASTSSEIWSFTTLVKPTEAITIPSSPSGPASGFVNQDLAYGSSAVNNLGHNVEYRFDWGDTSALSGWSEIAITHAWAEGTYQIKAQARCVQDTAVVSVWSDTTTVTITVFALETISTPGTPSGAGVAEEGKSINFATAAATSSLGHAVRYRFDFGDGTISSWSSTRARSYSWSTAGTYDVKAQARCADHPTIESDWSAAKSVTITTPAAETISTPNVPSGPTDGVTGSSLDYLVSGATSSSGHALKYRFDWGDGNISLWSASTTGGHGWTATGSYDVKVQAQCAIHPAIVSSWSTAVTVAITNPTETLTYLPRPIYGDVTAGLINELYTYSVAHPAQTNLGDPMEGQYDWGDGTTSVWSADRTQSHMWTTEGTYTINYQARCSVHNNFVVSAESLIVTMTATAVETIGKPGYVNWQTSQRYPVLNTPISYNAYGSLSSLGHAVEVRFDWGDGTPLSAWVASNSPVTKTWTTEGTYPLKRQARCITDPLVISEWSDPFDIVPGPEKVTTPTAPPGPAMGKTNQSLKYLGTGAVSSWHSTWIEYRFDWGDGSAISQWGTRFDTLVSHRFSTIGTYEVKTQARCGWPSGHTNPESEWSLPTSVNILESITYNGSVVGPYEGPTNRSLTFEQNLPATSSAGHAVEYRFDFGDGTLSNWSSALTSSHTYTTAGQFMVKCQARCATDTDAVSEWKTTNLHRIIITDSPETVGVPVTKVETDVIVGDSAYIKIARANSDYGDSLEYQIDYGDGTLSGWFPTSFYSSWSGSHYWEMEPTFYIYSAVGSYGVRSRGRCTIHPAVVSNWTTVTQWTTIVVKEAISLPATPTGPTTGTVGANLTFATTGSTSSEGHALEYYYSYRTSSGQNAGSSSGYTTSLSHTQVFASAGDYYLYLMVRCVQHNEASAGWSEKFYFTITN